MFRIKFYFLPYLFDQDSANLKKRNPISKIQIKKFNAVNINIMKS